MMYGAVVAEHREAAVVEEFGEGLLVVLLQFVVLIEQFFFFFFVLELERGVLENVKDDVFGLFFKEDVADAEEPGEFLELAVDDPFNG
jgi:hypothetical protein